VLYVVLRKGMEIFIKGINEYTQGYLL